MATKDKGQSFDGMTRRAFLKTAAVAGAVAGCGLDVAYDAEKAFAYENDTTNYKVTSTTCPYCSASCGQRVVTKITAPNAGEVVDIYGDFESPMNQGGLCAKGAGSLQLVNNKVTQAREITVSAMFLLGIIVSLPGISNLNFSIEEENRATPRASAIVPRSRRPLPVSAPALPRRACAPRAHGAEPWSVSGARS